MKQVLLIILCGFYLFATNGVRVSAHYCHGHLKTITLNADLDQDACCKKKSLMKKAGCCTNKIIEIKLNGEQKIISFTSLALNSETHFQCLPDNYQGQARIIAVVSSILPEIYSPPGGQTVPVHILNRTFRI